MEAVNSPQKEDARQESALLDTNNNTESNTMISVLKGITSLRKIQKIVEKNLSDLEKAIIF